MNPFLLRYVGFALAAVIAGAGGGYLAVNKTASPSAVTRSGVVPAIPAQPFPGQGIPAVPATPAIPLIRGTEAKSAPVLTSVDPSFTPHEPKGNLVNAGQPAVIHGSNFVSKHNAIFWDGKELVNDRDAYIYDPTYDDGVIGFTAPVEAKPGSIHAVAVKTQHGMSNTINVKVVEYFLYEGRPRFCGVSPYTGAAIGTTIRVCFTPPVGPYQYTIEKIYIDFSLPANMVKEGATGYASAASPVTLKKIDNEYSFVVPEEAVFCPSFIPHFANRDCSIRNSTGGYTTMGETKVKLTAGSYPVRLWYMYQYPYSTYTSLMSESWFQFPYGNWNNVFTITQ